MNWSNILIIAGGVLFWALIIFLIVKRTRPSKAYWESFERSKKAFEAAGMRMQGKRRGYIFADDTMIHYSLRRKGWYTVNYNNFNGYYYDGSCVSIYIMKPCSEHNQNELEKAIRILKASQ